MFVFARFTLFFVLLLEGSWYQRDLGLEHIL